MRPELEDGEITDDDLPELFDFDSDADERGFRQGPTNRDDGDSEDDGNEPTGNRVTKQTGRVQTSLTRTIGKGRYPA